MAARPWPYAEPSLATKVQFGLITFWMYWADGLASSLLLPTPRNQWVQPWVARASSVADGVTNGILAWSNLSPVAADSPENAGPMTPTNDGSATTLSASGDAWSPLPWVSCGTSWIFTGRFPNVPALAWLKASSAAWNP